MKEWSSDFQTIWSWLDDCTIGLTIPFTDFTPVFAVPLNAKFCICNVHYTVHSYQLEGESETDRATCCQLMGQCLKEKKVSNR